MSDKIERRASTETTASALSKHDERMREITARRDVELLRCAGKMLDIAGKVITSRDRQRELEAKRQNLIVEIGKINAERATQQDDLVARGQDLRESTSAVRRGIHEDLPVLLELIGDVTPAQKAEIVREFLAKLPSLEIKL